MGPFGLAGGRIPKEPPPSLNPMVIVAVFSVSSIFSLYCLGVNFWSSTGIIISEKMS